MRLNLATFNPFSSKYHALDDFRTLNFGSQVQIIGLIFFSTLLTVGIGSVPCFRLLVNRFKPKNKKEISSAIKSANSIGVNTLGEKHIQLTNSNDKEREKLVIQRTNKQLIPLKTKEDEKGDEPLFTNPIIDNLTSLDEKKKSKSIAQDIAIPSSFTDEKSGVVKKIEHQNTPISTLDLNSNASLDEKKKSKSIAQDIAIPSSFTDEKSGVVKKIEHQNTPISTLDLNSNASLDEKKKSKSIAQDIAIPFSFTDEKSGVVKKIEHQNTPISTLDLNSNALLDPNSLTFSGDIRHVNSLLNINNFKIKHNQTVIHIEIFSKAFNQDPQETEQKIKELEKKGKEVILVFLKNEVYARDNDRDNLKKQFPNRSFIYATFEDQLYIDPNTGESFYSIINQKKLIENIQHIINFNESSKTIQIDLSAKKESPSKVDIKPAIEDRKLAIDANQALNADAIIYSYDKNDKNIFNEILNNKSLKSGRFHTILHFELCSARLNRHIPDIEKNLQALETKGQKVILVILGDIDRTNSFTLADFKNIFPNRSVVYGDFQNQYNPNTNNHILKTLKLEEIIKNIQTEVDSF